MKWLNRVLTAGLCAALLIVAHGQYLHRQKVDGLIIANVALVIALDRAAKHAQRSCGGRTL